MTPVAVRDGWVRPVGHDPSHPASWTRLGTLDGLGEPIVDPRGFVQVAPGAPGVAWWIAGDDRWYVPSREKTVRQSLFHNTPVIETRMRVKGGDVCLRTYAVTVSDSSGLREVVAMEVENTTGVPCGVAFAVRPFGVTTDVPVTRLSIDGGVISADGQPLVVLPREPAGALSGVGSDGDICERVMRGEATGSSFPTVNCPEGAAQAVVVVPLAHRNVFRIALPVPEADGTVPAVTSGLARSLPPAENVARGWRAQVRDRARATVPDPRLQAVLGAAAPWAMATTNHSLAAIGRSAWDTDRTPRWDHVAATAGMLGRLGFHERAGVLLARSGLAYSEKPVGDPSWLMGAYRDHMVRSNDRPFAVAVAEQCVAVVAGLLGRQGGELPPGRRAAALDAAAGLLDGADESGAARAARKAARRLREGLAVDQPVTDGLMAHDADQDRCGELLTLLGHEASHDGQRLWEVLDRYLDAVTSTGVWSADPDGGADPHSVGVSAAVVSLALDFLVTGTNRGLRLIGYLPEAWVGRPLEVERVATDLGGVGYALRWHGDRPALLWELVAESRTGQETIEVLAPGLDSTWRGVGAAGEALLGPVSAPATPTRSGSRISGLQIGTSRGAS